MQSYTFKLCNQFQEYYVKTAAAASELFWFQHAQYDKLWTKLLLSKLNLYWKIPTEVLAKYADRKITIGKGNINLKRLFV